MSDKKYDDLYDELENLEFETGLVLAGSPTQKVQGYVIDSLKKVKHSKPMLSANKTKDIQEIKKFSHQTMNDTIPFASIKVKFPQLIGNDIIQRRFLDIRIIQFENRQYFRTILRLHFFFLHLF